MKCQTVSNSDWGSFKGLAALPKNMKLYIYIKKMFTSSAANLPNVSATFTTGRHCRQKLQMSASAGSLAPVCGVS